MLGDGKPDHEATRQLAEYAGLPVAERHRVQVRVEWCTLIFSCWTAARVYGVLGRLDSLKCRSPVAA